MRVMEKIDYFDYYTGKRFKCKKASGHSRITQVGDNIYHKVNGRYCQVSEIGFQPKPVQQPHPPIWVGGHTGPALRRAAELGDGSTDHAWFGSMVREKLLFGSTH